MSRISLLLALLCMTLAAALIAQQRVVLSLRETSQELQRQLSQKTTSSAQGEAIEPTHTVSIEASPINSAISTESVETATPEPSTTPSDTDRRVQGVQERSRWMVARQIERAERYTALSPEERERVEQAMTLRSLPLREALRTELGEERSNALFAAEDAEREEEEKRQNEDRVLLLSRKLTLTADQEQSLRQALNEAGQETSPLSLRIRARMEELSALHTQGEEARPALRAGYDELRALRSQLQEEQIKRITDKVSATLSAEQRSALAIELAREARPAL